MLQPTHRQRDRLGRYYAAVLATLLFGLVDAELRSRVDGHSQAMTTLAVGSTVVITQEI